MVAPANFTEDVVLVLQRREIRAFLLAAHEYGLPTGHLGTLCVYRSGICAQPDAPEPAFASQDFPEQTGLALAPWEPLASFNQTTWRTNAALSIQPLHHPHPSGSSRSPAGPRPLAGQRQGRPSARATTRVADERSRRAESGENRDRAPERSCADPGRDGTSGQRRKGLRPGGEGFRHTG